MSILGTCISLSIKSICVNKCKRYGKLMAR